MKILCLLQSEDASDSVGIAFIRSSSKYHIASENYVKSLKKKGFQLLLGYSPYCLNIVCNICVKGLLLWNLK